MPAHARKIIVAVVGFSLLIAGAILFVLPTPVGWIVIPASLIVLSTEYRFARRWLTVLKRRTGWFGRKLRRAESAGRAYAARVLARMPLRSAGRGERDQPRQTRDGAEADTAQAMTPPAEGAADVGRNLLRGLAATAMIWWLQWVA